MTLSPPPFPARLRQRMKRPKPRLRVILTALFPALLLLIPQWRLDYVDVTGCEFLPEDILSSCRILEGTAIVLLDLGYFRRQIDSWPTVQSADVAFELPGTVRITARPATSQASVAIAHNWHGVTGDGRLCGRLDTPRNPILHGFAHRRKVLHGALQTVRRIESASSLQALSATALLPGDLEIHLQSRTDSARSIEVRATRRPTSAERWWSAQLATDAAPWTKVDLRFENRAIVGGAL